MPGMNSGVDITDPLVLAAFRSALLHQLIIAVLIFAVLGAAWLTVRAVAARFAPASLRNLSFGPVASLGAVGLIILGAVPMAAAQASRTADPILAQAIAGSAVRLDFPATGFRLTDQRGRTVTPAGLRRVWAAYGLAAPVPPGGSVTGDGDAAWVIDRHGQVREELSISPGPGTAASESSFAVLLAGAARQFLQPRASNSHG